MNTIHRVVSHLCGTSESGSVPPPSAHRPSEAPLHHLHTAALVALAVLSGCAKSKAPAAAAGDVPFGELQVVDVKDPNAEVVPLHFDWPSGEATVTHRRTRQGPGVDDVSITGSGIIIEKLRDGGVRVQRRQMPWRDEDGEPLEQDLIAFTIDYAATMTRDFQVSPEGEYIGTTDEEAWDAVWADAIDYVAEATAQAVMDGVLTDAYVLDNAEAIGRLLQPSFREGKDGYNWNRAFHTWDGLELRVGTVYQRVTTGPVGSPALEVLSLTKIDDCDGNGAPGQCLTLFYETTNIPADDADASAYGESALPNHVGFTGSQIITRVDRHTLRPFVVVDTTWSGQVPRAQWMEREAVVGLMEHVQYSTYTWLASGSAVGDP